MAAAKKTNPSSTAGTPSAAAGTAKVEQVSAMKFVSKNSLAVKPGAAILSQFEDLSLPPIIKTNDLAPGSVIFGKITKFGKYEEGNIRSALITLDILEVDESGTNFEPMGFKAAMPVGAVLARALGTKPAPDYTPDQQIATIKENGYGEGTFIAMRYNGTGKERGEGKNRPHLWDIKAKKPTGDILDTTATAKKH